MMRKQIKAGVAQSLVDEMTLAARSGDVEKAEILRAAGCDIDQKDQIGVTALMHAATFGHVNMVDWLIAAGCDMGARSVTGATAMMHAASWRESECLERMLAAGCCVDGVDMDGETALMYAVRGVKECEDSLKDAAADKKCIGLLLAAGCDIDAVDLEGRSACVMARERGIAWAMGMMDAERERRELAKAVGVELASNESAGRPLRM